MKLCKATYQPQKKRLSPIAFKATHATQFSINKHLKDLVSRGIGIQSLQSYLKERK